MGSYRSIWTYLSRTPHRLDWVDVKGVRTRYLEAGKKGAPVAIMLHGLGGSLENFSANIAPHAEHFHVFAIDLVGSGWSDRPDYPYHRAVYVEHLRGFMDAMNIDQASFIGVSLGTLVSAAFALRYPERVASIVMVTPAGIVSNPTEHAAAMAKARQSRQQILDNPTWDSVRTLFKRLILKESDIIDDIVAVRFSIYATPEMRAAMPHVLSITDETPIELETWRKIKTPTLIIGAPDGQKAYYENAKLIHSLVPNSRLFDIKDVDHWAQFEAPDIFNPKSIAFIQEMTSAPARRVSA